jgi:DNA polymerase III epsilon subunit-like protein
MREIVLDTETTGLEHELGHRIIEIGAVGIDQPYSYWQTLSCLYQSRT